MPLSSESSPAASRPNRQHWRELVLLGAALLLAAAYVVFLNPVIDYRSDQKNDAIHLLYLTQTLAETGSYPTRHWPPGLAMLFAPVWVVFGLDLHVLKLGVALMGLGTAFLCYRWYRVFVSRIAAALLALSVTSSPLFFDYSHRFLTEIPFVFWLMVFLCLSAQPVRAGMLPLLGRCTLLAIAGGMAQLTRGNGTLLVPALVLAAFSLKRLQAFPAADRLNKPGILVLLFALLLPSLVLFVRNAGLDYPGTPRLVSQLEAARSDRKEGLAVEVLRTEGESMLVRVGRLP